MAITNLQIERLRKGLTQWDIAQAIGCNRAYISMLENSREIPNEETSKKLENYFNKPINYLLKKIE